MIEWKSGMLEGWLAWPLLYTLCCWLSCLVPSDVVEKCVPRPSVSAVTAWLQPPPVDAPKTEEKAMLIASVDLEDHPTASKKEEREGRARASSSGAAVGEGPVTTTWLLAACIVFSVAVLIMLFIAWLSESLRLLVLPLLHHLFKPLLEAGSWMASGYITAAARHYKEGTAEWVAMAGLLCAGGALGYSTKIWLNPSPADFHPGGSLPAPMGALLFAWALPLSLRLQSHVLGFAAVAGLSTAANFAFAEVGTRSLHAPGISAAAIFVLALGLNALKVDNSWVIQPLRAGLATFGCVVLLATGLLLARGAWGGESALAFVGANAGYLAFLGGTVLLGKRLQLLYLSRSGKTFAVLWLGSKLLDLFPPEGMEGAGGQLWVVLLPVTVGAVSLWQQRNPNWIASMFDWPLKHPDRP